MNIYVQTIVDLDKKVDLTLDIELYIEATNRSRHFHRNCSEPLEKLEKRMLLYLTKTCNENVTTVSAGFYDQHHEKCDTTRSIHEMIQLQVAVTFQVHAQCHIPIQYNVATVKLVRAFSSVLFAHVPIVPLIALENCTLDQCIFRWFCQKQLISENRMFCPRERDIGHLLEFQCEISPLRHANIHPLYKHVHQVMPVAIRPLPEMHHRTPTPQSTYQHRRLLAQNRPIPTSGFRLLSYNLLFDQYVQQNKSETYLPYCPEEALDESYRMPLVLLEMLDAKAQICCVQEMGLRAFKNWFDPTLSYHGMHSKLSLKTNQEGCAIFYRQDIFDCLDYTEASTADLMATTCPREENGYWWTLSHPEIQQALENLPTRVQFLTLRHRVTQKTLLVVNTHLFYRNDANLVRLAQVELILTRVSRERAQAGRPALAVVLAGDWNAQPETAAMALLRQGRVDPTHRDWTTADFCFSKDTPEPVIQEKKSQKKFFIPPVLHSDLHLAVGGNPSLSFTTCVPEFCACLDYIFYDTRGLESTLAFPMFSKSEFQPSGYVPSLDCPSDHCAVIGDFAFM